jgi:thioredoxin 2
MAEAVKLTCLDCGQANRVPGDRLGQGPKCGSCGAPLVSDQPREIDLATLEKAVGTDGLPLLVDFWAPWCGPCRAMAPEFARAAAVLKGRARLAKVNTDRHADAAIRYQIRGIPALILFRDGGEAGRLQGARPASDIVAFVRDRSAAPA